MSIDLQGGYGMSCHIDSKENRLKLLTDMIKIDTTGGKEASLAEMLVERLAAVGIEGRLAPVEARPALLGALGALA